MAEVIIKFKIMPESPEVDLDALTATLKGKLEEAGAETGETETQPVAFGLKALFITCLRDEAKGDTEDMEKALAATEGVGSVSIEAVGRTLG